MFVASLAVLTADVLRIWFWGTVVQGIGSVSIALLFGIFLGSFGKVPERAQVGIKFSANSLLKIAVALVGLRLSLSEVSRIGLTGLPFIAFAVVCSLAFCALVAKALRLDRRLTVLVGFGTAICGVSAIMAAASICNAKQRETTYAVCLITIFGFVSLFVTPFVANTLFSEQEWAAGVFIGSSVHDTAQVAGAALLYEQLFHSVNVLDVAMVTKMIRNLSLALLAPILAFVIMRQTPDGLQNAHKHKTLKYLPGFIVGFVVLSLVRTLGDVNEDFAFGVIRAQDWWRFLEATDYATNFLVTIATAAIGMNSDFSTLRAMGWRPLFLGFASAVGTGAAAGFALVLFS